MLQTADRSRVPMKRPCRVNRSRDRRAAHRLIDRPNAVERDPLRINLCATDNENNAKTVGAWRTLLKKSNDDKSDNKNFTVCIGRTEELHPVQFAQWVV